MRAKKKIMAFCHVATNKQIVVNEKKKVFWTASDDEWNELMIKCFKGLFMVNFVHSCDE